MKKLIAAAAAAFVLGSAAHAVEYTVGMVTFDTDDAATDVLWAQGGVFSGLAGNLRSRCVDVPPQRTSTQGVTFSNATGTHMPTCRATEAAAFDVNTSVELDENNTADPDPNKSAPDVLAAFFANPLVNSAGVDVIVFETLNQDDPPALTLILNGAQLLGTFLGNVTIDGKTLRATGFDFSNSPLNIAMNAVLNEPLYIQTTRDAQNTPVGSSDIVAIVGVNQMAVPLPAAMWLFMAGFAGLGFAGRKRKA